MENIEKIIKVAIYVRVSTLHQVDKDSLPLQKSDLINYSKYVLNTENYEIFEDAGYSGGTTERPAYQDMIKRIKKQEFTHVLVWKIDRISRNLRDFSDMYEEFKKYNVTFISKNEQFDTSSAMGEAMLKIILVFAELERKLTSERVYAIMISRAQKGLWNGATVPLGYDFDEEIKFPVVNYDEAEIVQAIFNYYEEFESTPKVANLLNMEGIPTKRNGKWTHKTVNDILRNPFYIGTYRYNTKTKKTRRWKDKKDWVVLEDNHEPIISKDQFYLVNEILDKNLRGNKNHQRVKTYTHIFSGILTCAKCGSNLVSSNDRTRGNNFTPSKYTCYNYTSKGKCKTYMSDLSVFPFIINYINNYINLQNRITDKYTLRDMERRLLRGPLFDEIDHIEKEDLKETYNILLEHNNISYELTDDNKKETNNKSSKISILMNERKRYEKALEKLDNLYLFSESLLTPKEFANKRNTINENIEKINKEILESNNESKNTFVSNDEFYSSLKASFFILSKYLSESKNIDGRHLLETVDMQILKDFIGKIISNIEINDKKIQNITFKNGITHHFIYK